MYYSLLPLARRRDSLILGNLGRTLCLVFPNLMTTTNRMRVFIDSLQPSNPLGAHSKKRKLPALEIIIAATEKDFELLPFTIEAAIYNSCNPIESIQVVVPPGSVGRAQKALPSLANVLNEETFLPSKILEATQRYSKIHRRGWVIQQLIGLYGARNSEFSGVLVLDSDTLICRERVWLDSRGRQVLSFSYEYHEPYEDHAEAVWGRRKRHKHLSFITHHMLMQPEILRQMFPSINSFLRWIELGNLSESSSVADYHSYGRWLTENLPRRVAYARWANVASDFLTIPGTSLEKITELQRRFPHCLSVSSHSWARQLIPGECHQE